MPKIDWAAASQYLVASSSGTFEFLRRKSVSFATAYPLSGYQALWITVWYYILLNLLMAYEEGGGSTTLPVKSCLIVACMHMIYS